MASRAVGGEHPARAVGQSAPPRGQLLGGGTQRNLVIGPLFGRTPGLRPLAGDQVDILPARGSGLANPTAGQQANTENISALLIGVRGERNRQPLLLGGRRVAFSALLGVALDPL